MNPKLNTVNFCLKTYKKKMATFKICVFKHQKRKDDKYPVSIRVYWQKEIAYLPTEFYVSINQISQKKNSFELKDVFLLNKLNERIELFEREKQNINLYDFTARQLASHFQKIVNKSDTLPDFFIFAYAYCQKRAKQGKSYLRIVTSLNNLSDFTGGKLQFKELTSKKLTDFEEYLRTERKITRTNQFKQPVTMKRTPCSTHCIADYMRDIRTVFNAALLEFNDDDTGNNKIHHYPFRKYKIPQVAATAKRNLSSDDIVKIIQYEPVGKREIIARDVFLLSFYLVGMNTADIYALRPDNYNGGRITYNRQKTRTRRKDDALISIKVESEASEILEKYNDPMKQFLLIFYRKYSNFRNFQKNINLGLKTLAFTLGINKELSTYYARHSWATIARNDCKISKSDVAECLNHSTNTITDIYIAKDWKVIDEANFKVLDFIRKNFVKNFCSNGAKNSDF